MNDSDETVRRLLTVAAEDVPPGIDLLRGLQARRRARRARIRVLLAAGTASVLAASAAIGLSVSQAPSALAQVTAAAARTAAQSYRMSAAIVSRPDPPISVTGEFDPARRIGEDIYSNGYQIRYIGRYAYDHPYPGSPAKLPPGRHWEKFPAARFPGPQFPSDATRELGNPFFLDQVSPQGLLTVLQSAIRVQQAGTASGPGWTGVRYTFAATRHYRFTPIGSDITTHLTESIEGTVDVDTQGRVRQLDVVDTTQWLLPHASQPEKAVTEIDMSFRDFGVPVSVSAPPPSQTTTG
jgi:hypothetical protein